MQQSTTAEKFQKRTAEYFIEKAKQAKGKEKFLVALQKSRYISDALQNGLSFSDLKEQGFKFATV
ncbi:MAG: hypothetical protein ACQUYJ_12295 [Ferruginibacter sp.]|nr:hypothetical protein [Ferruginibacter sp.]